MRFDLAGARSRIQADMARISAALQAQRALGGWKDREKFKLTDLELVRYVDDQEQQLRVYVVKLTVLQTAANSNRLLRWVMMRRSGRIAKALDAVGP